MGGSNRIRKPPFNVELPVTGTTSRWTSRVAPSDWTRKPSSRTGAWFFLALLIAARRRNRDLLPRHLEQVQAGLAGRRRQIRSGVPTELQDFQIGVDQHAGGDVSCQEDAVGLFLHVGPRLAAAGSLPWSSVSTAPVGAGRRAEGHPAGGRFLRVDLVLGVLRLEQVAVGADGLRGPQQEEAGRLQGIVEERQDLLLQRRLQVDEQVAAADQVDLGEGRIGQHVVPGEHAHVADRLADAVAAVHLREEAPQALRRDVVQDVLRVDARAGLVDDRSVQVGGEDLDRELAAAGLGDLGAGDRDRVGLLAGRAAQHPDAHRLVGGAVGEQPGQDGGLERLEGLRVAEEARHVDEDVLVEGLHFPGVLPQEAHIVLHTSPACAGPCGG